MDQTHKLQKVHQEPQLFPVLLNLRLSIFLVKLRDRDRTRQHDSIIHHIVQLIELPLQPQIKDRLIEGCESSPLCRQDLCAFFEVVDVVDAEHRHTEIGLGIILVTWSAMAAQVGRKWMNKAQRKRNTYHIPAHLVGLSHKRIPRVLSS